MGEPIKLTKGEEEVTLYGRHEAAQYVADGWQPVDATLILPVAPPTEINATDAAIKLAEESGVDLSTVTGTGKDGRIGINDVRGAMGDE